MAVVVATGTLLILCIIVKRCAIKAKKYSPEINQKKCFLLLIAVATGTLLKQHFLLLHFEKNHIMCTV